MECLQAHLCEFQTHCLFNGLQYVSGNVHFVRDLFFSGFTRKTLKGSTSHENEFIIFLLDLNSTQLVTETTP